MKLNQKRKYEIVEIEDDFDEDDDNINNICLDEFSYKKYKFIQAFSQLSISINDNNEHSNNQQQQQQQQSEEEQQQKQTQQLSEDNNSLLDNLYNDLAKSFSKNVTITYKDRISYKKKRNPIYDRSRVSSKPSSNDSLVLYKGNSLDVLVNNFMNYMQSKKGSTFKLKYNNNNNNNNNSDHQHNKIKQYNKNVIMEDSEIESEEQNQEQEQREEIEIA